MIFNEEDILLRIFISESAHLKNKPLYEQIVLKAKELKLAGATVTRGIMGFGADFHLHTSKIMDLSVNLPIIIEIIDKKENIKKIQAYCDEVVEDGFMTLEKVSVVKYRHQ